MNLKALPHETTLRFVLLIAVAFALALDVADRLSWHVFLAATDQGRDQCRAAGVVLAELDACMIEFTRARLRWDLAVALGVLALGVAVALVASVVRRRGLEPAPPQVVAALQQAGGPDPRPPLLSRSGVDRVSAARADGIRRPYVEISAGFMGSGLARPQAGLAKLRHEYAHHELGDVVPTRITLWLPWVLVAMVGTVLVLPQPAAWRPVMLGTVPRTLLLVMLMFLIRASFLRAREIAADHEAREPDPDDLLTVLRSVRTPDAWWRRPFASHPVWSWREQALRDPAAACRVTAADGLLLGLVTAACGTVVSGVLVAWTGWQPADPAAAPVVWGVLGGALGYWVAAMIFRVVAAARCGRDVSPAGFALGLGAGVAVGGFLLLGQPGTPGISFGVLTWAAAALLGATAVALAGWLWSAAHWWLDLDLADRGAAWTERGVQLVGVVAGGALLGAAAQLQVQAWTAVDRIAIFLAEHSINEHSGYDLLAVLVVAGLPLWFLSRPRRPLGGVPGWLSRSPRTDAVPAAPAIRPGLRTAVIGGLVATGAYAGAAAVWTRSIPRPESWFAALIEAPTVLLAPAGVVAVTVVGAALRAGRCRLAAAMVPGCLAVAVATLGIVAWRSVLGGRPDWPAIEYVLANLAVGGLLGGLVLAAVVLPVARSGPAPVLLALPVLAAVAGVALVAGAARLSLSPVSDLHQVGFVHQVVNSAAADARDQCRGEPVTADGARQARAAVDRLHERDAGPVTADVRRAHLRRVAMWQACAAAIEAALAERRPTTTSDQQRQFIIVDGGTVWLRLPSLCERWADLNAPRVAVTCD
ncbi:hypothetical protein BJY16_004610 [Actinoplanes octamycinicus]|uniref:Peptidase M48-like protein n=1 Tax=Actinoplanes octamycinicus TaxID=135948 RepID=A0A7W7M8U7_9ACTN|nr:hypothetical protein [Actinoplanes octamycinicus]MBB4741151.1 hypothetical protein [Actinoplanes octamycinicus]GIE56058.1 hypothetical protein Aoc01nite_14600 [Actinoplanes octamycinicus]